MFCDIKIGDHPLSFFCTFFYAFNSLFQRKSLWKEVLEDANFIKDVPWLVIGDSNSIYYDSEKCGGINGKSFILMISITCALKQT